MPHVVDADDAGLARAAAALDAGRLVAFPTETVYGLGADAAQPAALAAIYRLKGRPADNPLIAHVTGPGQARALTTDWDDRCDRLAARFWPGPLTLVLTRAPAVPAEVAVGRATLAVRAPAHPAAQSLLAMFGRAIAAPSANRSGHVSPTSAAHVLDDFPDADDLLVLDGGSCPVGIESTIVDLTAPTARLLRPGTIGRAALASILDGIDDPAIRGQDVGPGTSAAHYAPAAATRCVDAESLVTAGEVSGAVVILCFEPTAAPPGHEAIILPRDADVCARRLYAALRDADARHPALILIERPPTGDAWTAIRDRIERACAR